MVREKIRFSPQQDINLINTDPMICLHSLCLLQFPRILLSLLPPLSALYVVYWRVQICCEGHEARSVISYKRMRIGRRSCLYLKPVTDETCQWCCVKEGILGPHLRVTVGGQVH